MSADGEQLAADSDELSQDGSLSEETLGEVARLTEAAGGAWSERPEDRDAIGRTMFDLPTSDDNTVTVLLPRESIGRVPSQALVRIRSLEDCRTYLAVVVKGPFAEPDGLRADAPVMVTTSVHGAVFLPRYHGRVQVEILGEELDGDTLTPPRFRPLPNSRVYLLGREETERALKVGGDLRLGLAVGHEDLEVRLPARTKAVLPRHLGILGTTGGGKSTTVAGLLAGLQREGVATIVFDTEGEYTEIGAPTADPTMLSALCRRSLEPRGVPDTALYHLIGRDTANPHHPRKHAFSLSFPALSPYAVMELLELNEAQEQRFQKAYDLLKRLLERLEIFPVGREQEARALEIDELEQGWPELTLARLCDVVALIARRVDKAQELPNLYTTLLKDETAQQTLNELMGTAELPGHISSWRALQGKLGRVQRLRIFDNPNGRPLDCAELLRPGRVSIIDLSDTDGPLVRNLAIAELLRGIQQAQDAAYEQATAAGREPVPVEIVIEEAHEFLSRERIARMPNLSAQVARIARRGRKRWLGLVFVTQLPQHLPDEVLGLLNSWVLHKIGDANVVSQLRRQLGGIDDSLWKRLPALAPGQAIVSLGSMARPLLVAIDPAPCRLRMVD